MRKGIETPTELLFKEQMEEYLSVQISQDELDMFYETGRSWFGTDEEFRRTKIKELSKKLLPIMSSQKEQLQKEQRVIRIVCLCTAAVVSICII